MVFCCCYKKSLRWRWVLDLFTLTVWFTPDIRLYTITNYLSIDVPNIGNVFYLKKKNSIPYGGIFFAKASLQTHDAGGTAHKFPCEKLNLARWLIWYISFLISSNCRSYKVRETSEKPVGSQMLLAISAISAWINNGEKNDIHACIVSSRLILNM